MNSLLLPFISQINFHSKIKMIYFVDTKKKQTELNETLLTHT